MKRATFAVLLSAACAPEPSPLALPSVGGMASAIVAVERLDPDAPSMILRVVAIDLSAGFTDDRLLETPAESEEPRARITAIFYARTLQALGFARGELSEADPGRPGRRFPEFDAAHRAELGGREPTEWIAISMLSRELEGLRLR